MSEEAARLFTAVAAFVGLAAFIFTIYKNYFDARRSREISARQAWEKYLEMAFANPTLARVGFDANDPDKYEQYEWFVSRMLYAAEEVLLLSADDRNWTRVIETQVSFHRDYLNGIGEQYIGHYSDKLRPLIKSGLNHA